MRSFRSWRLVFLALLVALIPASSYAGVFISVGFAPPALPVYVQPPCPEPGLMWTPGYWAYGPDGYYWVPGAWVPAPYVGALWTPGYWGWSSGLYVWHAGYWGPHVGYYGGVNYGFGYMGIGFVGGEWHRGAFAYNTAIMHVGPSIHNTYVNTAIIQRTTIINNTHVSYNGGPGGINHTPTREENTYAHEQHLAPTSFQVQHRDAAMHDTNAYANHNGGRPSNLAVSRPLQGENHPAPVNRTTVINNNVTNNNISRSTTVNRNSANTYNQSTTNNSISRSNTTNENNRTNNTYSHPTTNTYNNVHPSNNTYNRPPNSSPNLNRPVNEPHPSSGGNHPPAPQEHPAPRNESHGQEGHGHER